MKRPLSNRSQQAANYYDESFRYFWKLYLIRTITKAEFIRLMNESKKVAETNCRKDIIQAFDMGFKYGVFWHIESSNTKETIGKYEGTEYYQNIFEGGEHDNGTT
jgi:hypothetical protein